MSGCSDLTGTRVGIFTVNGQGAKDKFGSSQWFVNCPECGIEMLMPLSNLKKTKRCRTCANQKTNLRNAQRNYLEVLGKTFSRLTVLDTGFEIIKKETHVTVVCSCGKTPPFTVSLYKLKNEKVRSCRCLGKESRVFQGRVLVRMRRLGIPYEQALEHEKYYAEIAEAISDVLPVQE